MVLPNRDRKGVGVFLAIALRSWWRSLPVAARLHMSHTLTQPAPAGGYPEAECACARLV
jgi:hypothetical protein